MPSRSRWISAVLLLASAFSACATPAASAAVSAAVVNTAVGVGVAGYERSQGRCVSTCPVGTACVPKTGLCEPLPCRGRCQANERCEQSGLIERCVPASAPDLRIETSGAKEKKSEPAPAAPPPATPMPAPEAPRVTPQ